MISDNSELGITWLGQGGFLLKNGGVRIVVDPYLSDSLRLKGFKRSFPAPVQPEEISPDMVCVTHDRGDHFDEQTLLSLYKFCHNCVIMGPKTVTAHCRKLGFNPARLVTLAAGENTFSYDNIRVRGVQAFNGGEDAIGLTINASKFRIYISSDTQRDDSLALSVRNALGGNPDIMMVCVNGRNGCMDDVDAFRLVRALQPKIAIPMNYGLFADDTADLRPFVDTVTRIGIESVMLEPGKLLLIHGETPFAEEQYSRPTEAVMA